MIPAHELVADALAQILERAPLCDEKVDLAWRAAVGASVHHATTTRLRDRVLYVRARDASWQREVERAIPVVMRRLARTLGPGTVREIHVSLH